MIYQVQPRSFQDSDGDGVGDLGGIAYRLDYVAGLGVDAIRLAPISPGGGSGQGHAGPGAIDPAIGDLAAFDRLVAAIHARGLRLILDCAPGAATAEASRFWLDRGVDGLWMDPRDLPSSPDARALIAVHADKLLVDGPSGPDG